MKNRIILMLILFSIFISCFEKKTYLTNEEKKWNPYQKGQTIVFESNKGLLDSIFIDDVIYQFPDGLGIVDKYEILNVVGVYKHPKRVKKSIEYIFSIHAKTEKRRSRLKFRLTIGKAKFYTDYFYVDDSIFKSSKNSFSVPYGKFNDVTIIENKMDYSNIEDAIEFLYWSESAGYIRFDKYDGTSWKLNNIINGNASSVTN